MQDDAGVHKIHENTIKSPLGNCKRDFQNLAKGCKRELQKEREREPEPEPEPEPEREPERVGET